MLADPRVDAELEVLFEPRVEMVDECFGTSASGGSGGGGLSAGGGAGGGGGVNVVDQGQVGIFLFSVLDATSAAALTDWLDQRSFPYEPEALPAFEHYAQKGWLFVAFTVSPDQSTATRVCGNFGPIELSFPTNVPVVPARIATADLDSQSTDFVWQVSVVTDRRMRPAGMQSWEKAGTSVAAARGIFEAYGNLYETIYADALTADELAARQSLSTIAEEGDWVTGLLLGFRGSLLEDDFTLEPDPSPDAFQRVEYVTNYVDCGDSGVLPGGSGGAAGDASADSSGGCACRVATRDERAASALVLLGLVAFARRRRRCRARGMRSRPAS